MKLEIEIIRNISAFTSLCVCVCFEYFKMESSVAVIQFIGYYIGYTLNIGVYTYMYVPGVYICKGNLYHAHAVEIQLRSPCHTVQQC